MSRRPAARLLLAGAVTLAAFLAFAVAVAAKRDQAPIPDPQAVTFEVHGDDGEPAGQVVLRSLATGGAAEVDAQLRGLPPGYHALRVHDAAACDTDEARFASTADDRGVDADALPPLLALKDGTATYTVRTDRLDVARLVDGDGSAVVVQGERGRIACGAVR